MKLVALFGFSIATLIYAQESDTRAKLAAPAALVKSSGVEPLVDIAALNVSPDHRILLEPGVYASLTADGYAIATRDGSKVQLNAGDRSLSLVSPVMVRWTEGGWDFGTG